MISSQRYSVNKEPAQIKNVLELLYRKYNHRKLIKPDPMQFVYRYSAPADMEIAAFLSAALAYGRVQQIEKSLTDLFARMADQPSEFVINFDDSKKARLKSFKHRFTTGSDISDLLQLLKKVLREFGSIEKFFLLGYRTTDSNIIPALSEFCDSLLGAYFAEHNREPSRGLKYLLTTPAAGSACKRLNLFLRWMVRDDDVDTGLWKSVDKAKLIVPIDIHMSRLCRILGFYDHKTVSLSAALKITDSFKQIEPNDPVKYDFSLSRIGIIKDCNGRYKLQCPQCQLFELCQPQ